MENRLTDDMIYDNRFLKKMKIFCLIFLLLISACEIKKIEKPRVEIPKGMVLIPGGSFQMGSEDGMPDESPVHTVQINSFLMDEHEVTAAEFAEFVEKTGYRTEAEKFGCSGVFNVEKEDWEKVDGADWRHPEGKNSNGQANEPVSQISWNDAEAFAKWAGKRLPKEAEFEYAARGGLPGKKYAWGNELRPNGKPAANWWQGDFPNQNTIEDGFLRRAPVKSFPPNGYGLYDLTGNVWEWTNDWYDENYYQISSTENPQGPDKGVEKTMRGGSWMCSENYCSNYRVAGRSKSTPDTALNNLGFRCVKDIEK
jgi:sulfatase modifying factor 1